MPWGPDRLAGLRDRTVVVTGATSGLGEVVVRAAAAAGAKVVLAVRNTERGEQIARDLPGARVRRLDLADLASVHEFSTAWDEPIDVLINNAGIMAVPYGLTVDGFERQLGTNHLGPFALTVQLLPHLRDRVVTVASLAHRRGSIDLSDPAFERRTYTRADAYAQSKLANLLFTLELQRRLSDWGPLRAYAAHPGFAATQLMSHTEHGAMDRFLALGTRTVAQSSQDGAQPVLYAAVEDLPPASYVGPDGFAELRGAPTLVGRSRRASDPEAARRLWADSARLTGVDLPSA